MADSPDLDLSLVASRETDFATSKVEDYVSVYLKNASTPELVLVDGLFRNACIQAVLKKTQQPKIVVLDNSDRLEVSDGIKALEDAGYGRIDFFGPVSTTGCMTNTSLFSQDFNSVLIPSRPPAGWYFDREVSGEHDLLL